MSSVKERHDFRFGINGCALFLVFMIMNVIAVGIVVITYAVGNSVFGVDEILALAAWFVLEILILCIVL